MDIGRAIKALRGGFRVARAGWNGRGMWLGYQAPDDASRMTLPYVFMRTVTGDLVPWLCSQTDLLADDWALVAPETVDATHNISIDPATIVVPMILADRRIHVRAQPNANLVAVAMEVASLEGYAWKRLSVAHENGRSATADTLFAEAGGVVFVSGS